MFKWGGSLSKGEAAGLWKHHWLGRLVPRGNGALGRGLRWEVGALLTTPRPHRRRDTSITCMVPGAALPAPVPVCVRLERRGCLRGNLTFWYMQNPVITAISPRRSPVR